MKLINDQILIDKETVDFKHLLLQPKLVELDLSIGEEKNHPDIQINNKEYLVLFDNRYYSGTFSKQWFGLSFNGWCSPLQYDKPGTNHSRWQRIWAIENNDCDDMYLTFHLIFHKFKNTIELDEDTYFKYLDQCDLLNTYDFYDYDIYFQDKKIASIKSKYRENIFKFHKEDTEIYNDLYNLSFHEDDHHENINALTFSEAKNILIKTIVSDLKPLFTDQELF